MRRLVPIGFSFGIVLACSSDGTPTGDAAVPMDAAADTYDPCSGLGCATILPTLDLTVLDSATQTPVKAPTFKENGNVITAACTKLLSSDGGPTLCWVWHMTNLAIGAHAIDIAASGYTSQTLKLTLAGPPNGCCGTSEQAVKSVSLATP